MGQTALDLVGSPLRAGKLSGPPSPRTDWQAVFLGCTRKGLGKASVPPRLWRGCGAGIWPGSSHSALTPVVFSPQRPGWWAPTPSHWPGWVPPAAPGPTLFKTQSLHAASSREEQHPYQLMFKGIFGPKSLILKDKKARPSKGQRFCFVFKNKTK